MIARSVGLAIEVAHDGAVKQPIEHRGRDWGVAEDHAPGPDDPLGSENEAGRDCYRSNQHSY